MREVNLGLCEVNSCMQEAEKEFDLNGQSLRVCAKHSFVSYRSADYVKWKVLLDKEPINFHDQLPIQYEARELTENRLNGQDSGANLRIIKSER